MAASLSYLRSSTLPCRTVAATKLDKMLAQKNAVARPQQRAFAGEITVALRVGELLLAPLIILTLDSALPRLAVRRVTQLRVPSQR